MPSPTRVTLWFNPSCSKSRMAQALLEQANCEITIRDYMSHPPSLEELSVLADMLGVEARDLLRTKEALYESLQLAKEQDPKALLLAIVDHPILLERPIALRKDKAVIARPPERVQELFD